MIVDTDTSQIFNNSGHWGYLWASCHSSRVIYCPYITTHDYSNKACLVWYFTVAVRCMAENLWFRWSCWPLTLRSNESSFLEHCHWRVLDLLPFRRLISDTVLPLSLPWLTKMYWFDMYDIHVVLLFLNFFLIVHLFLIVH